ncbi:MAG TPA: ABC transporter permease [Acidobacteriota bacterium]|nr:ABC transporter permease [Acidobacteriota bacterium]
MRARLGFLWEATRLALQSIFANKLRTFLTLLGIIIGVASVMVVGAGIEGLQTYVLESVSKTLGSDSFLLAKFARIGEVSQEEWERMVRRNKDIRLTDLEAIRRNCDACGPVVAELSSRRTVYYSGEPQYGTEIRGVTHNFLMLASQEVVEGRYFTENDIRRSQFVCVIGWDLKEKFFPGVDPLGKRIRLGTQPLEIIGVLERLGTSFGQSLDNTLHIPISTYQRLYGIRSSITIRGKAISRDLFEEAIGQVRMIMRVRHKLAPNEDDDFGLISTEEINSTVDQFTGMIAVVVVPITLISLVVGGIVVMNIMLVSVTERTFEIGLRKALGARRRDILNQFLIESFFTAAAGGVIGLILATVASELIQHFTSMTMTISLNYILLSVGVSGGIGLLFGIYPAYKASKLDPIEAMRAD